MQLDYHLTMSPEGQASLWDNPQPGSFPMRLVQTMGGYSIVPKPMTMIGPARTVGELLLRLQNVPAASRLNITILPEEGAEPTDHPVADTSYDSVSETFDLFIDL